MLQSYFDFTQFGEAKHDCRLSRLLFRLTCLKLFSVSIIYSEYMSIHLEEAQADLFTSDFVNHFRESCTCHCVLAQMVQFPNCCQCREHVKDGLLRLVGEFKGLRANDPLGATQHRPGWGRTVAISAALSLASRSCIQPFSATTLYICPSDGRETLTLPCTKCTWCIKKKAQFPLHECVVPMTPSLLTIAKVDAESNLSTLYLCQLLGKSDDGKRK